MSFDYSKFPGIRQVGRFTFHWQREGEMVVLETLHKPDGFSKVQFEGSSKIEIDYSFWLIAIKTDFYMSNIMTHGAMQAEDHGRLLQLFEEIRAENKREEDK